MSLQMVFKKNKVKSTKVNVEYTLLILVTLWFISMNDFKKIQYNIIL